MAATRRLPPVDFDAIVNQASERFERDHHVRVSPQARQLLVRRGESHQGEVEEDLARHKYTVSDLSRFVYRQLEEAFREKPLRESEEGFRRSVRVLTAEQIARGMERECHFFPFC